MNQPAPPQAKRHLGQILIDQGILTEDQLRIALLEQTKQQVPLGKLLVQLGFVSEATLRDALSEKLGLQSVDLARIIVDPAALKHSAARHGAALPHVPGGARRQQRKFIVALSDTDNIVASTSCARTSRASYEIEHAPRRRVGHRARRSSTTTASSSRSTASCTRSRPARSTTSRSSPRATSTRQPVVRLISALLADAVERGGSDIHFEPEQDFLRIRYRIDGVLRQIRSLHKNYWPAMVVRLKVMAKMNIAETRAPQDGRISATHVRPRGRLPRRRACRRRTARTWCCASSTARRASCRSTSSGSRSPELEDARSA